MWFPHRTSHLLARQILVCCGAAFVFESPEAELRKELFCRRFLVIQNMKGLSKVLKWLFLLQPASLLMLKSESLAQRYGVEHCRSLL